MFAEPFAVIAGDDDGPSRRSNEAAELLVHRRNLTEVEIIAKSGSVRLGRRVRKMRIVIMHPEKQRLCRWTREVGEGAIGGFLRRTYFRPHGHLIVIDIEAPPQSETSRDGESRDKRRGAITCALHLLREHRDLIRQIAAILVHAVSGGIETGHDRSVRGESLWNRRVGLTKKKAAAGQRVEIRCGVRPDRI